jgi:hypothetical protein
MNLDERYDDGWGEEPISYNEIHNELDVLAEALYSDIMQEVREMLSGKNLTYFKITNNFTKPNSKQILDKIYEGLVIKQQIPINKEDDFHKIFSGDKCDTNPAFIKWEGTKNLCVYLIERLAYDFKFLDIEHLHKKTKSFFLVPNGAKQVNRYKESKEGKPHQAFIIDDILNATDFKDPFTTPL